MNPLKSWRFVVWLLLGLGVPAAAQNHPELDWRVLESDHFRVMYHQGLEEAAARAAQIAEDAYGPVTQVYGYEPGEKVRLVLKDFDDYANGAAFFYHDTIEIWTTALDHDFDMRGTSDWLRNVITHEFVHIISLGAARKWNPRVPALYLQYFGYQRENDRPDILIGYPDVIASYPVSSTIVPMWFAEGVAQYQVLGARHDRWDSHRDMILRTAVRHDRLLSFDEMGVFGKKGFGNEFVYDHGYGLVSYIAATYGEDKLAQICRGVAGWRTLEIDGILKKVLGKSSEDLHQDWRQTMAQRYNEQLVALGSLRQGETVADKGFSNIRPTLSPTGDRLAYLSTGSGDHGPHALVVKDLENDEDEVLVAGVASTVSWAPDGRKLLFVRKSKGDKYGSRQADIYEYDLDGKKAGLVSGVLWTVPALLSGHAPESPKVRRISHGLRAFYPAYSPDGKWIAFVHNQGTHNNLGLMRADGSDIHYLTKFSDGTQFYTPQWSPDGRHLVFAITRGGQRDIALIAVEAAQERHLAATVPIDPGPAAAPMEIIIATPGTDRDPVWSQDGRRIIFASDADGIFNIYSFALASRQARQLTNLEGGGFNPTVGADGALFFAAYGPDGYEIRTLKINGDSLGRAEDRQPLALGDTRGFGAPKDAQPGELRAPKVFDDLMPPAKVPTSGAAAALLPPSEAYGVDFLRSSFFPRLMWNEGRFKGGVYFSNTDAVGRQNLFAGAALAPANQDRDLFAIYEYKGWRPTLFLEFFHQKRNSVRRDSSEARDLIFTGTNFSLNQLNVGLRGHLAKNAEVAVSLTYDRYDASVESDAFVPRRDGQLGFERIKQKPFGYTYLNGFDVGLTYRYEALARRRDRDISPRGRRLYFRYDRIFNFFIEGFDQTSSFLQEEYLKLFYNQLTLDWNEFISLPAGLNLGLRFYGGWIDNDKVDDPDLVNDFFDYHLGGIQFMRGYTFYSIEGRKAAMGQATLRFPLLPNLKRRFLHLYLDKVYGAVYGDLGKAWDRDFNERDPIFGRKGPLRDVGGQLRFDSISYYSMPTRVQVDLAYGIDEVDNSSPWKFYMTVLFGYL
jgi:Tol biopolymer transport system component